jgi:hypothetical protein
MKISIIKSKTNKSKNNKSKNNKIGKKIKEIIVKKIYSDNEMEKKEGKYFKEKDFLKKIKSDADIYYYNDKNQKILLAKFRKSVIPKEYNDIVIKNLKSAAKREHDNRGPAAGNINLKKLPVYINTKKLYKPNKSIIKGYYSNKTGKLIKQNISNMARSNIIGFYDKPNRNLGKNAPPCRLTQFNANHPEKFQNVIPFIKSIDRQFKSLIPNNHKKQLKRAKKTNFLIEDTAFSTITVNYNWRTACHKDKGDFKNGFGNLVVCEEGNYKGGFTGFPQFGICFDVRKGDFLAMDVHEWHCNTPLKGKEEDYCRLSVVCYLREKMIKCSNLKVQI